MQGRDWGRLRAVGRLALVPSGDETSDDAAYRSRSSFSATFGAVAERPP
jgi:hypothetical protein